MLMLAVLAIGLTIDLSSKWFAFENVADVPVRIDRERVLNDPSYRVPWHDPVPLLPADLLNARLVWNYGAVFGLGQRKRFFFIAFTVAAVGVGVLLFARWTREHHRLAHVAIGCILAGGLGNLYDRARFGVVRDFLHIFPEARLPFSWTWPGSGSPELFPWVFNVADTLLLLGMLLLMVHINRVESRRQKKEREEQAIAEHSG